MRNQTGFLVLIMLCIGVQFSSVRALERDDLPDGELVVNVSSSAVKLEGATVLLSDISGVRRVGVTGRDGVCRFRQVSPGSYSLRIVMPAYFFSGGSDGQAPLVELSPGEKEIINISLIKGGVISGRVINSQGHVMVGLPLTAVKVNDAESRSKVLRVDGLNLTALSDDRGQFRIYGLKPGRYAIAVNAQRNLYASGSAHTFYYKAQGELANADLLDVFAGQETMESDMVVDLETGTQSSISGRILGLHSLPMEGVFVSLRESAGGYVSASNYSDRDGRFTFEGLPPGKYEVKVQPKGENYFSMDKWITVQEFSASESVFQLRPFSRITGTIILNSPTVTKLLSTRVRLGRPDSSESLEFVSDTRGTFSVVSGITGIFWWSFPSLPKDQYVETIRSGTEVITQQPLKLDEATGFKKISIQLVSPAASLSGRLSGAENDSCSQFAVYAVAVDRSTNNIRTLKKADICIGSFFNIYSLPPGEYHVLALSVRSDGLSVAPSFTKFQDIRDDQLELVEKALADFAPTNNKPLVVELGKTYGGLVPQMLPKRPER